MLTSKEIIERTGISRATLNNYIASGLVPRPQVLPPGPEHGAAPRIGYFPDDTIERVETIQRLKREGWSIARIADHLSGQAGAAPATAPATAPGAAVQAAQPPQPSLPLAAPAFAPAPVAAAASPTLTVSAAHLAQPAYLVNDSFRIVWASEGARSESLSPLATRTGTAGSSVFAHLFSLPEAAGRDALIRFHLQVARTRAAGAAALARDLAPEDAARLQRLFDEPARGEPGLVVQANLPAGGGLPARAVHALQFREGVLFAYAPAAADAPVALAAGRAPAAPTVSPVAVLVGRLQDARGLWVKLTAQEYFELLNEIWAELDRIFRRHRGRTGRPGGEVLVCYFLPQADSSHLWNALAAAHQTRDAMRQVSHRWQLRKGWDVELCLNTGIDEGQDWMGVVGATGEGEFRVVGDTADHAEQLSLASRMGAILVTRSLLGKLSADDRQRLTFGVPRLEGARGEAPLLFTFARLADIAVPSTVPARFADLPVAELMDLNTPASTPVGPQEG